MTAPHSHQLLAIVVEPGAIPIEVRRTRPPHTSICVFFFGSHDYGWVTAARLHPFELNGTTFAAKRPANDLQRAVDEAFGYFNGLQAEQVTTPLPLKPTPYTLIKRNRIPAYLRQSLADTDIEDDAAGCGCSPSDPAPCSARSTCFNHRCYIECDDRSCVAGVRCQNRCFANGPQFCVDIRPAPRRGYGLFAGQRVPANAFVIEYVGEVVDHDEYDRRRKCTIAVGGHFYFMQIQNGIYIDATHYGNASRFINHSCEPNAMTVKWSVAGQWRIGIYTVRSVECVSTRVRPTYAKSAAIWPTWANSLKRSIWTGF